MEKKDFKVRNRMTIAELKATAGDEKIQFFRKTSGTCFFMCGDMRGYVSPAVGKKVALGEVEAKDLQFGECQMEGSDVWVPTIMMAGAELLGTM